MNRFEGKTFNEITEAIYYALFHTPTTASSFKHMVEDIHLDLAEFYMERGENLAKSQQDTLTKNLMDGYNARERGVDSFTPTVEKRLEQAEQRIKQLEKQFKTFIDCLTVS